MKVLQPDNETDYRSAHWYLARVFLLLVVMLLVSLLGQMWRDHSYGAPGTTDFLAFWSAGQLLKQGENPHDIQRLSQIETSQGRSASVPLVMVNPTWLLVWLFPLFLLTFPTATIVWLGTNLAILLIAASLLWLIFVPNGSNRRFAVPWMASVIFVPALLVLRMGQTTGIVLLGLAGFLFFQDRKKDRLAGGVLALTTIKPHLVYLVWIVVTWWILTERRWKVLLGGFGTLALTSAVLTFIRGNWIADYHMALNDLPLYWATPTVGGILRWSFGNHASHLQFLAPVFTGLLAIGYLSQAESAITWERIIGPILLLSVTTAAYGWTYDQIVLLIPYLQLVTWLLSEEGYHMADRAIISGGLILYLGSITALNLLRVNAFYGFWIPWILAGVYAYGWWRRRSIIAGSSTETRALASTNQRGL